MEERRGREKRGEVWKNRVRICKFKKEIRDVTVESSR
jgi:hypothetical protein